MTLKDYIDELNFLVESYPEALGKNVYYSVDDEGNEFNPVLFSPSIIEHDGDDVVCIN